MTLDAERDPLAAVDNAVRRAAQASASWHEALAQLPEQGPTGRTVENEAPLSRHREVATRSACIALRTRAVVSQDEAWRLALCRWAQMLTVLRVSEDALAAQNVAERALVALVRLDRTETTSFRAAFLGLVRSQSRAEGQSWLDALASSAPRIAATRRERAVIQEEAVGRLGFPSLAGLVEAGAPGDLDTAATSFLAETRDLALALRREAERKGRPDAGSFVGLVEEAVAHDAPHGWPARLTPRSLRDTMGAPADFARGLRLQVAMPTAVGASSFARALEAFGVAYRRSAAAASSLPFAVAVDPYFIDAHRFGFVFGALPTTAAYQKQGLGLGARVATEQARTLARTALLHARGIALASLVSRAAARPDAQSFEALVHDVYGEGVPAAFAGAFPRALPLMDEPARVHALLTALPFALELRDQFEEDWFRNPSAWRFLRARASGPARPAEEAAPAPSLLARAFEEALG